MKKLLLTFGCLCLLVSTLPAQTYITRTGKISFNATAAGSPEKIDAVNNEVANIIDAKTGNVVFQAPIKSFKFLRELMQEHFNEDYMESDKFPKTDFKGTITNLAEVNFTKDGNYTVKVSGKLTMHGVTKDIVVPGTITVKGNTLRATAKFSVKLSDYNVNVPSVVADKIGKEAVITLESALAPK